MAVKRGEGQSIKNQLDADHALKGQHNIGDGLFLRVTERKGKLSGRYVLRLQYERERKDYSIGSRKKVKLAEAKRNATLKRLEVEANGGHLSMYGDKRSVAHDFTLNSVVTRQFEKLKPTLKGDGIAGRWLSPLSNHVLPTLGEMSVQSIDAEIIQKMLAPIWHKQPHTAIKAFNRLRMALLSAGDDGANIIDGASEKARRLLGPQAHQEKHIARTPFEDVPALYTRLCALDQTPPVLALRLTILTIQRLRPVRLALSEQFDLDRSVWTIPAENLKGLKGRTSEFRCPLSSEASSVVKMATAFKRGATLFPSYGAKGVVSDGGIAKVLERLDETGRPHGFRSSFGDWSGHTSVSYELAEMCLQHVVGSKVSRAYRRNDLLEERRPVMDAWAALVTSDRDAVQRPSLRVAT